jgi:hypothetical protein
MMPAFNLILIIVADPKGHMDLGGINSNCMGLFLSGLRTPSTRILVSKFEVSRWQHLGFRRLP